MTTRLYRAYNGPAPTTASQLAVTTGTTIKTMLQIATPAGVDFKVKGWGVSMDGAAAAAGVQWELFKTSVAATVTAHVAADIAPQNVPTGLASGVTLGTAATGYTSTVEGTPAAVRMFDSLFVQPTGAYVFWFPLGEEPVVGASEFLRVRCKAAVAVNALCFVEWAE